MSLRRRAASLPRRWQARLSRGAAVANDGPYAASGTPPSVALGRAKPAATAIEAIAAGMAAGQWAQVTGVTGLTSAMFEVGPTNTTDWADKWVYDPVRKQMRFTGQGHQQDQKNYLWDWATNVFSTQPDWPWDTTPAVIPDGHAYNHNTMDPTTGDYVYWGYNGTTGRLWARSTNTWSDLTRPGAGQIPSAGVEWLPSIGSAGGLIVHQGTSCYRWDRAANTWSTPENGTLTGQTYHTVAVRSIPNALVFFGGNSVRAWKIGATGGATALPDCPAEFGVATGLTTACPVSGEILVIRGNTGGSKLTGIASSPAWSALTFSGAPSIFGGVVDPVAGAGGVLACQLQGLGVIAFLAKGPAQIWLYKHA